MWQELSGPRVGAEETKIVRGEGHLLASLPLGAPGRHLI